MFFSLSDSLLTPWLANMVKQGQDEKFLSYLLGFFVSLLTPSSAGMIKQGKTRGNPENCPFASFLAYLEGT